ncbi:MAG: hypothetical protein IH897_10905 [Planctomycetes bacterium]|nr:hypothetical protein [Planctomycetota bacterium]
MAGHYSLAGSLRGAATIYLYPANANASPPDRDAFIAHFEQTKSDVILGSPLATFLQSGGVEAKINGFELAGAHARYLLPEHPMLSGPVDSHLYLFVLDGWYLKFRFSHPEDISDEVIPMEQRFISSVTWPVPDEAHGQGSL